MISTVLLLVISGCEELVGEKGFKKDSYDKTSREGGSGGRNSNCMFLCDETGNWFGGEWTAGLGCCATEGEVESLIPLFEPENWIDGGPCTGQVMPFNTCYFYCGDGEVNAEEQCDPGGNLGEEYGGYQEPNLNDYFCDSLPGENFDFGGELNCFNNCTFNTTGCIEPSQQPSHPECTANRCQAIPGSCGECNITGYTPNQDPPGGYTYYRWETGFEYCEDVSGYNCSGHGTTCYNGRCGSAGLQGKRCCVEPGIEEIDG